MIFLKFIKIVSTTLLLCLTLISLYISTAFILSFFPSKSNLSIKKDEKIYIVYDNVHSDIVFNLENISDKWIKELPIIKNKKVGYIAFGWGDKETYLNTPTWNDIKISTSLKALFINTSSLMHITYYPSIKYFIDVKPIDISKNQIKQIKKTILKSFNFKEEIYKGYGYRDLFYTSPYKYNFIYTCNSWTGNILRDANISISYWTPFSQNIISSLP
jgi:uncharacterized protein (TIGR02117 family)